MLFKTKKARLKNVKETIEYLRTTTQAHLDETQEHIEDILTKDQKGEDVNEYTLRGYSITRTYDRAYIQALDHVLYFLNEKGL